MEIGGGARSKDCGGMNHSMFLCSSSWSQLVRRVASCRHDARIPSASFSFQDDAALPAARPSWAAEPVYRGIHPHMGSTKWSGNNTWQRHSFYRLGQQRSVVCGMKRLFSVTTTPTGMDGGRGLNGVVLQEQKPGAVEKLLVYALSESKNERAAIVKTREEAKCAVKFLLSLPSDTVFACDTETTGVDPKSESPVGHGKVVCLSVYAGPTVNFAAMPMPGGVKSVLGDQQEPSRCLWVDTLQEGVMEEFKLFLECDSCKKVWHNYSFDKHVLGNHGVRVQGFAGDTIHMARLWNQSFGIMQGGGGYSLSALSSDLLGWGKTDMKAIFSKPAKTKSGAEGKMLKLQDSLEIQTDPLQLKQWIRYSTLDTKVTYWLYELLKVHLKRMEWTPDPCMFETDEEMAKAIQGGMFALYELAWRDFGELLTDIEARGIHVDVDYLKVQEAQARNDVDAITTKFLEWASENLCPDASRMNLASQMQKRQLFFGSMKVKFLKDGRHTDPPIKVVAGDVLDLPWVIGEEMIAKGEAAFQPDDKDGKTLEEANFRSFDVDNDEGFIEVGKQKATKLRKIQLSSLKIRPTSWTKSGLSSASGPVLKNMAGSPFKDPPKYGSVLDSFPDDPKFGKQVCEMIHSLAEADTIRTILNTFLSSLPGMTDPNGRVHTSLNINTETGRLSSQRPNLQNQPALEKDVYGVRKAFCAPKGKKLIVADYGQLELRIMAHMTNCQTMIDALEAGGDFHSRTAIDMYENVKEACDRGEVLLEWDKSKGEAPAPMLKDKFASERRKAKTLNFSIAYGKTKHGLAKDWGVTVKEASETIDKWYAARKEVRKWQETARATAARTLFTTTLLGRKRLVTDMAFPGPKQGHAGRAVINTPIQGGAADVVAMGMLKIHKNEFLKNLGWEMILQIHDELILEGPEETAEEAFKLVKECMEQPLQRRLKVALPVDGSIADNWYEGK